MPDSPAPAERWTVPPPPPLDPASRLASRVRPPEGRHCRDQCGQSSVQLVAIVPAFLIAVLAAAQLVLGGHALWSAGIAARAGARAAHVGNSPNDVALRTLPGLLRGSARVSTRADGVRVRVKIPTLVPGLPSVPLVARAALQPG